MIWATGCGRNSAIGFHLPDGDAENGRAIFVAMKCHSCHTVDSIEKPFIKWEPAHRFVPNEVGRIKTYSELVTSVINPSHRLSAQVKQEWEVDGKLSPMPNYNRDMTVEQMIDLVAFLQSRYNQLVPLNTYL
jgi:L-cysteine S-thiosulfotransferase